MNNFDLVSFLVLFFSFSFLFCFGFFFSIFNVDEL